MNGKMGLLSDFQGGATAAPSGIGGLLGDMGGMPQQAPQAMQGGDDMQKAKKFAAILSQAPTPETVQMIVADLQKNPSEGAQNLVQALTQSAQNPEALMQIAQIMNQRASAQNG